MGKSLSSRYDLLRLKICSKCKRWGIVDKFPERSRIIYSHKNCPSQRIAPSLRPRRDRMSRMQFLEGPNLSGKAFCILASREGRQVVCVRWTFFETLNLLGRGWRFAFLHIPIDELHINNLSLAVLHKVAQSCQLKVHV